MGEVVVSCEEMMDVRESNAAKVERKDETSNSMVRWERFLPRVSLRVLLVEADDSTRQIISALLRKCSYKVASVPDGLKAWEVLKSRPHNIDLILTEVELPSISGYALLTLMMEHEICKNIPVIMMSAHDSVSTVYKCMLRGAADFLVKPIRINELKNLWQHVWRRQTLNRQEGSPVDGDAQQKIEATAENNASSDQSSSSKACATKQQERKGSDAQSSCGKQDVEAENTCMDEDGVNSLPKPQVQSNCVNSGQNLHTLESAPAGLETSAYNNDVALGQDEGVEHRRREGNTNLCAESRDTRDVFANTSREAIDFIGALDGQTKLNSCLNDTTNKHDYNPQLDLSLRRFNPGIVDTNTLEKQLLNHSNASAFTRYVNKALPAANPNATSVSAPKEDKVNSTDQLSDSAEETCHQHRGKTTSLPVNFSDEVSNENQNALQRLFPIPFPARGTRVDVCSTPAGYGSSVPPLARTPSPSNSPSSAKMNNLHHFYQHQEPNHRISPNQPMVKQDQKLESSDDRAYFSLAGDQSATSSLYNNNSGGHIKGYVCGTITGSHAISHQDTQLPGSSETGNDQVHTSLKRQQSLQREAALYKFRLKRKERCFEKKVRYESRKKLAEQRPRVKGQFVRQVPPDPPPPRSVHSGEYSAAI